MVYQRHKTCCADTLLSNSVMCAIGVLQHDDTRSAVESEILARRILKGAGLQERRAKVHFGLQHFCLSCCSTPIAHITELDNNVSAHQVL